MSWRHQMPKQEIRNTFYWITWEVNTVWWWNLATLCNITKECSLQKYSIKNMAWKLVQKIFKESSIERSLRRFACWFGQILIVLLKHIKQGSLLQKSHFPIEIVLNSLQTQKDLELVFRLQFLWNSLINFFLL